MPLHPLLESVLTLLKYFGLLFGAAAVCMLVLVGLYAAMSGYASRRRRRRFAIRDLRAWVETAFPAVEWDQQRERYISKADPGRQA